MTTRRKATLRTTWGPGTRGRGARRTASRGGSWFHFDPFAIASWVLPRNRKKRRRR